MTVEEILTFKNDSFNKPRYIKPNNITDYKTDEECPKDVFKRLKEILLDLKKNEHKMDLALACYALINFCGDYDAVMNVINMVPIEFSDNNEMDGYFEYIFKIKNKIPYCFADKIFVKTNKNPIDTQETLIHELRHALNAYYYYQNKIDDNKYMIRTGLVENYLELKNKELILTKKGKGIEELFNSYISNLQLNDMLSIKNTNNIILGNYMKKFKNPQPSGFYENCSYDFITRLSYPMLLCSDIVTYANIDAFKKDNSLKNFFNTMFKNVITYEQLVNELDYLISINNLDNLKRILEYKKNMEEIHYTYQKHK